MKVMFISDIHGIKTNLEKIKIKFKSMNCDKLVVLGDLFYLGTGNNQKDYDPCYVKEFLESFNDKLICTRGNCDSSKDLKNLKIHNIEELTLLKTINNDIYLTHGHIYNSSNWNRKNSILIYGHYHIPFIKHIESNTYISPGSISIARQNYKETYLIYDEEKFTIYDINDNKLIEEYL